MSSTTAVRDLVDPYGRTIRDLRISVTDRCNFRCTYCMPAEGMVWLPKTEVLTFEEIERLARIVVEHFGVDGIRLTGGEPTMRAHLPVLVAKLAALSVPKDSASPLAGQLIDLAITTNGATLANCVDELKLAGIARVNISLDTLDRAKFEQMTRRDELPAYWPELMRPLGPAFRASRSTRSLNVESMTTKFLTSPNLGEPRALKCGSLNSCHLMLKVIG